ncbi:Mid2-like cell wall stress sensor [Ophiocordyceps camponoti-floridani]|uniref:Mid2-like cell wall stress sensor n=1 Tax=Ophiocordyceps camponoti-floridani TaxID=2030778 RepID=A0A8H4QD07_9HYPO|nr:Mid2-like cell wall stress sensor [Ophiocordyceps camponoti-floridani]
MLSLHPLAAAVSLLCVAHALRANLDAAALHHNFVRQLNGVDGVTSVAVPAAASPKSEDSTASPTPASSSQPDSQSSTPPQQSSESSPKSSAQPSPSPSPSRQSRPQNSDPPSSTTSADQKPDSTPPIAPTSSSKSRVDRPAPTVQPSSTQADESSRNSPKPTPTPSVFTTYEVVTITNSDGSKVESTSAARITTTPGLNAGAAAPENPGMSVKTRNTIIGVVVGVGGAIVLGALFLAGRRWWWGKKQSEESDGLMDYDMTVTGGEKPDRGSAIAPGPRTPFQSTLENYHQPTQVNASSNF